MGSNEVLITADETKTMIQISKILFQSGMFDDTKSEAQAFVKVLAGREFGLGPFESMRNLYIIKGKTAFAAGYISAKIKRSGKYDYKILSLTDDGSDLEFYENGKSVGKSSFNKKDAQAAGLFSGGSGMYAKFPRNMYFSRALTNGARWYCPEVFGGPVYTPDELRDDKSSVADLQISQHQVVDAIISEIPNTSSADIAKVEPPAQTLDRSVSQEEGIEDSVLKFGKHKGKKWSELETKYVAWLSESSDPKFVDIAERAKLELDLRAGTNMPEQSDRDSLQDDDLPEELR